MSIHAEQSRTIQPRTETADLKSLYGDRGRIISKIEPLPTTQQGASGISLIYGDSLAREIGFYSIAGRVLDGERVIILDGANEFNSYVFSDVAQRVGVPAAELLSRLLVSRVFTCHQLATLIVERTRPALERYSARTLVVLDMLTTFYDQEVPRWEAERLLRRPLQCLRWLGNHGYQVMLLCSHEPHHDNNGRRAFFEQIKVLSDRVLRVNDENGKNGRVGEWRNGRNEIVPARSHAHMSGRSSIEVVSEKPYTGERWQWEFETAFTRRRKYQPPMRWMNK